MRVSVFRRSSPQTWLLVVACLALLGARLGGAHLHRCLDGNDPPASVHFADAGHHHDAHHAGETHQDVDVSLIDDVPTKLGKDDIDLDGWMLPLAVLCWVVLSIILRRVRLHDPPLLDRSSTGYLRPPLRGPPLHAA